MVPVTRMPTTSPAVLVPVTLALALAVVAATGALLADAKFKVAPGDADQKVPKPSR